MATYIQNKKARLNYEVQEEFEAGIVLRGFEVKSIKEGNGNLEGAHVIIRGNEAFLSGATIPPYQPKNAPGDYDPSRPRKLLLTEKEIRDLSEIEKQKRLTIIPLSMYSKGTKIKVKVAVARGKKKHDKRQAIKKRDAERDIERSLKKQFKL